MIPTVERLVKRHWYTCLSLLTTNVVSYNTRQHVHLINTNWYVRPHQVLKKERIYPVICRKLEMMVLNPVAWPLAFLLCFFCNRGCGYSVIHESKPDPANAKETARWLVAQSTWGSLSTLSIELGGAPFGNIVSFSDGPPGQGKGTPYFYLSLLDPTPRNALKDSRCSLSLSEIPLGTCGDADPEDPTCSKLTLTGTMKQIEASDPESKFAAEALFSKHPEMTGWPKGHKFQIYKLIIENIFLVDWYGGAKQLSVRDYLQSGGENIEEPARFMM